MIKQLIATIDQKEKLIYVILTIDGENIKYSKFSEGTLRREIDTISNVAIDKKTDKIILKSGDISDLLKVTNSFRYVSGRCLQILGRLEAYKFAVINLTSKSLLVYSLERLERETKDEEWLNLHSVHSYIAEADKALFKNELELSSFLSQTTIKARGWTQKMIDDLLPPPLLVKNPHYKSAAPMKLWELRYIVEAENSVAYQEICRKKRKKVTVAENVTNAINKVLPESIVDIYINARSIKRHFIIHAGVTNSGKTYAALQRYKAAKTGVYLAPLRALAFEIYNDMNNNGVLCNLTTGEDIIDVEGAEHDSGTVEMLTTQKYYEVAVIDECQMLDDKYRGGAWTRAIHGVYSKEVHLCTAPNAVNLLKKIIEDCGDTYEIVEHERKTPLQCDETDCNGLSDIEEGDVIVLFSKNKVLSCAAKLQSMGKNVSVLYGAMPFEVRSEEIRKFSEGETQIMVSTDAIGMGVNLPARRIVFGEISKYDGDTVRNLNKNEIQQIAGRAGRYGKYEKGLYTTITDSLEFLQKGVEAKLKDIEVAKIGIPYEIINVKYKLSSILKHWHEVPVKPIYQNFVTEGKVACCKYVEKQGIKDKEVIYNLITLPVDFEYENICYNLWCSLVYIELKYSDEREKRIENLYNMLETRLRRNLDLESLENIVKDIDLLTAYTLKFNYKSIIFDLHNLKSNACKEIVKILNNKNKFQRKCKICCKKLEWDYKYGICRICYICNYGYDE